MTPRKSRGPKTVAAVSPNGFVRAVGLEGVLGGSENVLLLGFALVVVGVAFRLLALQVMDLRMDGNSYAAMGDALLRHGEFLLPWGDVSTWDCTPAQYAHHYPPLYPAYLAAVYAVAGFGVLQTKLASVAMALAALGVVFACTADLYGRARAWLVTGVLAVEPTLLWVTGTGFSENLVLLLFALTLWAILKSLKDERYILIAGLAAGLSYLTRSSMGVFFVVAGLAGLAWRFYYLRWAVLRNKSYLAAIALFGLILVAWAWRNVERFGWPHWETSSYLAFVQDYAFAHPLILGAGLAWKLPLFLLFIAHYAIPLGKECQRSLRKILDEQESALWLAIFLVLAIGWIIASVFWTYERYDPWWMDNRRYAVVAFLPLLWLALRHANLQHRGFGARFAALAVSLTLLSAYLVVEPVQFPEVHAQEQLNPLLQSGDVIGIEGIIIKYSTYAYLGRTDVSFVGCRATPADACPGQDPDYILSLLAPGPHPGYRLLLQTKVRYVETGDFVASVYQRDHPAALGPRPAGCALYA